MILFVMFIGTHGLIHDFPNQTCQKIVPFSCQNTIQVHRRCHGTEKWRQSRGVRKWRWVAKGRHALEIESALHISKAYVCNCL